MQCIVSRDDDVLLLLRSPIICPAFREHGLGSLLFVKILVSHTITFTRQRLYFKRASRLVPSRTISCHLVPSRFIFFILASTSFTRMEVLQVNKHIEYQNRLFHPKCLSTPIPRNVLTERRQTRFEYYLSQFRRVLLISMRTRLNTRGALDLKRCKQQQAMDCPLPRRA